MDYFDFLSCLYREFDTALVIGGVVLSQAEEIKMAKMIYTVTEMIEELSWTMEEVDEAIASSKTLNVISAMSVEKKREFAEWDDYHDRMQISQSAWKSFLATDQTGRDAMDFDISAFGDADKLSFGPNLPSSSSTITVAAGRFRAGDRIVILDTDTYIGRKGNPVAFKAKTIRFVEVYSEARDGLVKARFVIDEAVAQMSDKDQAFELASTDERRKVSQNAAAVESRKAAKALGGKALTGTAAQKKWAEEIRKTALATVSSDVADKLLSGKAFQSSKWWIENRKTLNAGWLAQQAA